MLMVSSWINAKSWPPKPNQRCLVFCRNKANRPGEQTHVATTVYAPGSSVDWPYLCGRWGQYVTHYILIPDDPAEEDAS